MSARVLVVDDVLPNVKLLAAKLTREYFEVITASNGPEALEMVRRESPDIVLLDVMMPGMDGPTTLEKLRALPGLASTPVVFMTAKVQPQEVARYRALGSLDVISKPFDPMTLPELLRGIWARRDA